MKEEEIFGFLLFPNYLVTSGGHNQDLFVNRYLQSRHIGSRLAGYSSALVPKIQIPWNVK